MQRVATLMLAQDIQPAIARVAQPDGSWLVYEPGDALPDGLFGPPPDGVPAEVTMRQARLALLGAGLLSQVESALDSLPEPQRTAARIEWEHSQTVQRHRGLVQQMGVALGMTSAQLDALFVAAAAIP